METSAGKLIAEEYDDGCARGLTIKLNGNIIALVDALNPVEGEMESEVRILAYRGDSDEPTDCISINR